MIKEIKGSVDRAHKKQKAQENRGVATWYEVDTDQIEIILMEDDGGANLY